MTREEYNKFSINLKQRGYRKYPSPNSGAHAWFKSFGKSDYEEERSNYQVCFNVFDFSDYADRDKFFINHPYSIEPMILVSRGIDERVDLNLSHVDYEDTDIDAYEKLAESFFQWANENIKIKHENNNRP